MNAQTKPKTLQELFADKSRWNAGWFAENEFGEHVNSWDVTAIRWCLLGGMNYVYGNGEEETKELKEVKKKVQDKVDYPSCYNDHEGYEAVLALVTELNI